MTREQIKSNWKKGERLTQTWVNKVGRVLTPLANNFDSPTGPAFQVTVKITSVEDATKGLYNCRYRTFNPTSEEWEVDDESNELPIDAWSYGDNLVLLVGDVMRAQWDDQRGAFIPLNPPLMRMAKPNADVAPSAAGTFSIWRHAEASPNAPESADVEVEARHDWMAAETDLLAGTESVILYQSGVYVVIEADCG